MFDGTYIQNVDIYKISSVRRNPTIASLFEKMNLMEIRGSGLKGIVELYENQENYKKSFKPEYHSTDASFFTILWNLNYDSESGSENGSKKLKPHERHRIIIEIIKQNPTATSIKLAEKLNVSTSTINRDLEKLTKANIIKYEGSSKKGKWTILKNNSKWL